MVQLGGGEVIDHTCLGGNVDVHLRHRAFGLHQHPHIGDNEGVHPHIPGIAQEVWKLRDLPVQGQGIASQVDFHPMLVGQGHPIPQFILVKVGGIRPHAELFAPQVHRIRPIADSCLQPLRISHGGEDLGLFDWVCHPKLSPF